MDGVAVVRLVGSLGDPGQPPDLLAVLALVERLVADLHRALAVEVVPLTLVEGRPRLVGDEDACLDAVDVGRAKLRLHPF
ncbi:hypothetical protein FK85_23565 [Halorubrum saccharovorum]|uniref:Uncharacterized protein n=1 Tax=Halorubrum saccharovorum TaxID=2248 RepID=A0A0F8CMA7_9EURY|nr:hypothetical protein FK85_23565 [Halorubrum saccharovorum]